MLAFQKDLRVIFLLHGAVDMWHMLPEEVVVSDTIIIFNGHLTDISTASLKRLAAPM